MTKNVIKVEGAKVHNLKNVNIEVPRNKLVVVTGVSGSGKSSLALDTLYAESQRRFIESFSSYVRQFMSAIDKPEVDKIEGLPPAISIKGQTATKNPRSTVGTMTEIYDLLRLLFSRIGTPHCPNCKKALTRFSISQIIKRIMNLPKGSRVLILSAIKTKHPYQTLKKLKEQGFIRVRINHKLYKIKQALDLDIDQSKLSEVKVVIDRFTIDKQDLERARVLDSVETALKIGNDIVIVENTHNGKTKDLVFSNKYRCPECGTVLPEIEPRIFSFNNPRGACPDCTGLGVKLEVEPKLIIPNPKLSLAEGGIKPWAVTPYKPKSRNSRWQILEKLAEKYNFSLHTPIKRLPQKVIDVILHGDEQENYPGVISELQFRYKQTDSENARSDIEKYMTVKTCPSCKGKKLRPQALAVTISDKNIDHIVNMNLKDCKQFFEKMITDKQVKGVESVIEQIIKQLQLLINVNLEYLSLSRNVPSLSIGEAQRVKIATQINSKLSGVMYVLDEPSIGLHVRDQHRLITALKQLRDIGNTVLVVEHDDQTILAADWIIDLGPGAGEHGGKITFQGTPRQLLKSETLTGKYLSGKKKIEEGLKFKKTSKSKQYLTVKGAEEHNLKNINVNIPLGCFSCVTGVSGSGKSTLVNDILAKALTKKFHKSHSKPGAHKKIEGMENLNKVVVVDQSPIGRTPRSNPATYTGMFTQIRELFANTKQAKQRRYKVGHFSFNVKGGRCEECQGEGYKKIEMYYLPDHYVKCPECHGKRYIPEILEVKYQGVNIAEVLEMTVEQALEFFKDILGIKEKLTILNDIGLSYLKLGQSAPSLSGGEAQRVKLATELSRKETGRTIYILDEPTTGLHPADIVNLLKVLKKLSEKGNTILVIEHNLDIIRNAEHVIDLGPEGGDKGGYLVAQGTPEQVMNVSKSYTGKWLNKTGAGQ